MKAMDYLEAQLDLLKQVAPEEWKASQRSYDAAWSVLGLSEVPHPLTYEQIVQLREVSIIIFNAFPDGLPEAIRITTTMEIEGA